jgi:protein-L-isoaspartate(D-aspartate) O-methyltransferase
MDFAKARQAMVDSQVRPADVTDVALLAALRQVPREAFAPPAATSFAYADAELDFGAGRYLLRPRHLAKLLQALEARPGERALEIAGATGYGAAVMAACGLKVTMLDHKPDLCLAARTALEAVGAGDVAAVTTDIKAGWAEGAPYDVIFLNGAAEVVPPLWFEQLADGGRLAVIMREGPAGHARLYRKDRGQVASRAVFDAAPPVLAGLEAPRQFAF